MAMDPSMWRMVEQWSGRDRLAGFQTAPSLHLDHNITITATSLNRCVGPTNSFDKITLLSLVPAPHHHCAIPVTGLSDDGVSWTPWQRSTSDEGATLSLLIS